MEYYIVSEGLKGGMIAVCQRRPDDSPGHYYIMHGCIGTGGVLKPPFVVRPPRNGRERKALADYVAENVRATPKLERFATQRGNVVTWCNSLSGMAGQRGAWTFATDADAAAFVAYATVEGAPALDDATLTAAGLALPTSRA